MRTMVLVAAMAGSLLATEGAEAAGCLKGAAVGGVAGHFAGHHAVLGAIAGCAIGHHRAAVRRKEERQQTRPGTGTDDESETRM